MHMFVKALNFSCSFWSAFSLHVLYFEIHNENNIIKAKKKKNG